MKPISFSRVSRPSELDPQTDFLAILESRRAQLEAVLENSQPRSYTKINDQRRELRKHRAQLRETIGRMYTEHVAEYPDKPPPDAVRVAEGELAALERKIGVLTNQLEQERLKWGPSLFASLRPHTDAMTPAIEHCIAVLEAAAEVHQVADKFVAHHGFLQWRAPRAQRLKDLAQNLKRFLRSGEAK